MMNKRAAKYATLQVGAVVLFSLAVFGVLSLLLWSLDRWGVIGGIIGVGIVSIYLWMREYRDEKFEEERRDEKAV